MNNDVVKLVHNAVVKELLQEANKIKHVIEIEDCSFMVRDNSTKNVIFRGIKIRNNCWGISFSKTQ